MYVLLTKITKTSYITNQTNNTVIIGQMLVLAKF